MRVIIKKVYIKMLSVVSMAEVAIYYLLSKNYKVGAFSAFGRFVKIPQSLNISSQAVLHLHK